MAGHWSVRAASPSAQVPVAAAAGLLDDLERHSAGTAALAFLSRLVPLQYLSMVGYAGDGRPWQIEGRAATWRDRQTTLRCFALYRSRFYRYDEATALAAELRADDPEAPRVELLHYGQPDIPEPAWREEIFVRERLAGRVTLMFNTRGGQVLSLNLYRDQSAGEFSADEIDRLRGAAPLLQVALRPHGPKPLPEAAAARLASMRERVDARCAVLSPRERDVAARIACGISNDGIAADLGVAPSTVQTLRKRVYTKLGIHHRMALAWRLR